MVAEPLLQAAMCMHCGLDVPPGPKLFAVIDDQRVAMCCVGCRAAAEMLESCGFGDWYARRESPSGRAALLPADAVKRIAHLESQALEESFVHRHKDGGSEVELLVDDLRCAACVWVIERHLGNLEGVESVHVLLGSRRVRVSWVRGSVRLRDLVERLAEIGFAARPNRPGADAERDRRENRAALIRLGVAGLGAMNVMTYAVALYAGAFEGMSAGAEALMRWMGWIVSTPIVVISARPFFVGAWRDVLRRRPGMDVPVALAIGGAYIVSAFATFRGTGEVYFDSVCMFTFFLTLGRYLEQRVQAEGASFVREMTDAMPLLARRLGVGQAGTAGVSEAADGAALETVVSASALVAQDRVRILPGEVIPADGVVLSGISAVDEALLSGEPWPRSVRVGDSVIAGSQNIDQSLVIEATCVGPDTKLAEILSMVERAASVRAPIARLADRVAGYFVTAVLGIALTNWIVWTMMAPERAVWTTLSVLVATCPCALSLATPMAISSASQGLARVGFLIANASALEDFARIDRLLFDKTGTLTKGEPTVAQVVQCGEPAKHAAFELAAALEGESAHPIARAFRPDPSPVPLLVQDRRSVTGAGVEGWIDGRCYRIGRADWASRSEKTALPVCADTTSDMIWILLSEDGRPLAWFGLVDPVRDHVAQTLASLKGAGIEVELLSGDPSPWVPALASRLGLRMECHGATPEQKLDRIRALQEAGERVALVGDGINDSPALRAADMSIAMGSGCDLSRLNADAILLTDDYSVLFEAHGWAKRTRRIIKQNLSWAVAYNLLALPLAVTGLLAPWMAALGMSASSLVVLLNAMRLSKRGA